MSFWILYLTGSGQGGFSIDQLDIGIGNCWCGRNGDWSDHVIVGFIDLAVEVGLFNFKKFQQLKKFIKPKV